MITKAKYLLYIFAMLIISSNAWSQGGWSVSQTSTSEFLYDVHFVDQFIGWACGNRGTILKTLDGGATWDAQKSNTSNWLLNIYFSDFNNGWACGDFGRIVHTNDGGADWIVQNNPYYDGNLNTIYFVNSSYGWAAGNNGMMRTTDGGDHWYGASSTTFTANRAVQFVNPVKGWACGDGGAVFISLDSGNSWQTQHSGVNDNLLKIYFKDENNGWMLHKGEPKLLRTTNGGTDWFGISSPIKGSYTGFSVVNDSLIYIAGQSGIVRTTDGGKTWRNQTLPDLPFVWSIHMDSERKGWAVGSGGKIYRTNNGGSRFGLMDFTADSTSGFIPLTVNFTNKCNITGLDSVSYRWSFGDNTSANTKNAAHTYNSSGTFSVTLSVSDGKYADSLTKQGYIQVYKTFGADFTANPVSGDKPLNVFFTDKSFGPITTRVWDFGDGNSSQQKNPNHVYNSKGLYSVKLIVSDGKTVDSLVKKNYITITDPIGVTDGNVLAISLNAAPNPFDDYMNITFSSPATALAKLDIVDLQGNIVSAVFDGYVQPGFRSIAYSMGQNLSAGNYLLRLCLKAEGRIYVQTAKLEKR